MLVPGLLAAGIGTLVSIGIGSFTGLSTSALCARAALALDRLAPDRRRRFGWTIGLAIAIALVASLVMRGGALTYRFV